MISSEHFAKKSFVESLLEIGIAFAKKYPNSLPEIVAIEKKEAGYVNKFMSGFFRAFPSLFEKVGNHLCNNTEDPNVVTLVTKGIGNVKNQMKKVPGMFSKLNKNFLTDLEKVGQDPVKYEQAAKKFKKEYRKEFEKWDEEGERKAKQSMPKNFNPIQLLLAFGKAFPAFAPIMQMGMRYSGGGGREIT